MLVALILTLLNLYSTVPVVLSQLVLESGSGFIYVPFPGDSNPTSLPSSTNSAAGGKGSSGVSSTLAPSTASNSNGLSTTSASTPHFSHPNASTSNGLSGSSTSTPHFSDRSASTSNDLSTASASTTQYSDLSVSTSNGLCGSSTNTPELSDPSASTSNRLSAASTSTHQISHPNLSTSNGFSAASTNTPQSSDLGACPSNDLSASSTTTPKLPVSGTSTSDGFSAASTSTPQLSDLSASVLRLSSGFITSKSEGVSHTSTFSNVVGPTEVSSGAWTRSDLSLKSALRTPSITRSAGTSSSVWPASITYVAESSNVPVVGVAFITTVNGTSMITTTQPQQSLVSATGSGYSLVAITQGGNTTTLTLANLPTATIPSEPAGVQVVTQSGVPVTYSPMTLSGYSNTEPIEVFTDFSEVMNGHTTVQTGWWLIGKGGRIYPPTGRPWRTGSGVGCLAGPLFCRTSCVDIGLFEVCYPGDGGGGGGETGPPGFPGGLIDGGGEPGDDPPPYEEPERVTEPEVSKTVDKKSTSVTRPASRSASATSSLTGSAAQYFIVATPGADVADINAFLGQIAPKPEGSYSPVFAADAVDGGFWTANLSSNSATLVLNRNDISIIATYTNTPASYPTWNPSTFSDTISVDLETLYASTISPSETAAAKVRRKFPDEGFNSDSELSSQDQIRNESAETQFKHRLQGREPARVYERDAGIRYVRQRFSPKDLSVLSWAPGRPSVDNVDFIFSERKGQNTWVYVLDTGINSGHAEFRNNWPGQMRRFNIDPVILRDPTVDWSQPIYERFGTQSHGTCMASKVCGGRTGVAKQATVISAQHVESFESIIAGLKMILTDIESRQANGQALPGRTVLSMSFAVPLARIRNPTLSQKKSANYMRAILQAIMNKGVVCVCAAGNSAQEEGFAPTRYPSILATDAFPLISVGAVDITGTLAFFSQQGVVYTVGVDSPCAAFREYLHETQADGTSGATAMFAGLVALKMSEPGNVYGFGRDITQYQQLVKNYYTVGYNGRNRALHPPGSWYRPGTYAPVAWNGLDGSQSTICPLSWPPNGALKKRDTTDPATSPDICAAYSYHSVIIYSRAEKSCLDSSEPICSFEYFLYAVSNPSDTPSDICNGAGFIGSAAESFPSNSISFNLPKNSGDSANENLDFLYTWTMDDVSGWVTGDDLTAPVACVEETSNLSLVQTCALKEYDSAQRRAIVPIPEPPDVAYVYAGFASCVWGSD